MLEEGVINADLVADMRSWPHSGSHKKVYEVDPLRCPACPGVMRIVAFIVDTAVIYRILKHLDLIGKDPPSLNIRGLPATGTAEWPSEDGATAIHPS